MLSLAAASLPSALPSRVAVKVPGWPDLPFPLSEGVLSCFCEGSGSHCELKISGNQGVDFTAPGGPALVAGGVANETKYAMDDIQAIVHAAGATMDDITACEVWLRNISDFSAMNDVYKTYWASPFPTRVAAGGFDLAQGAAVEIKCEGFAPCP